MPKAIGTLKGLGGGCMTICTNRVVEFTMSQK